VHCNQPVLHHEVKVGEHAVDLLRLVYRLDGDRQVRHHVRRQVLVHLPRVAEPDDALGGGRAREPVLAAKIDDLSPERLVVPPLFLADVDDEPLRGSLFHHILRANHVPSSTAANPRTFGRDHVPDCARHLPDLREQVRPRPGRSRTWCTPRRTRRERDSATPRCLSGCRYAAVINRAMREQPVMLMNKVP